MSDGAVSAMGPEIKTRFSQPSELETEVSRVFRAPVDRVFHVFTDRATMPYVWSEDPSRVTIETLEFRPGGSFAIAVRQDDGGTVRFTGTFLEVAPPRRVVNTWRVSSLPGVEAVETDTFEAVGDRTRVTIRWKYPTREDRDRMAGPELEKAVSRMWENLDGVLAKA